MIRASCGAADLRPATLAENGAIAQLGERDTGSVEVGGSIPPGSTRSVDGRSEIGYNPQPNSSPSSRGLGHRPFTAVTGVRLP